MLSKCSNPSCSALFRFLEDGKLFRLERDPTLQKINSKSVEYYWLCKDCASTMTLRLGEHEGVITVLLSPLLQADNVAAVASADRKKGLLLRQMNGRLPKHGKTTFGVESKIDTDVA